ncbi:HHIP-like protein 2 [Antedon mediterranea]|uniref:HHIP-like protein 2 n=1 Tax=Antedon mediterranea TaxID=105859 RepID=UPI003AF756F8
MMYGWIIILILQIISKVRCHPQCLDFYPPFETSDLVFCSMYNEISCCTSKRDQQIYKEYMDIKNKITDIEFSKCGDYIRDILCQQCSPYAAHLYDAESTGIATKFPGLCNKYCTDFYNKCSANIPLLTTDKQLHNIAKSGSVTFCDAVSIPDMDYCYPDILDDWKLNTALERALGGEGDGCLCLEEFATGLRNPLLAVHANDHTHQVYIAEQLGLIHIYQKDGKKLDEPFLDLRTAVITSDRRADERGLLGLAFHPNYKENRRLFIHYTTIDKKSKDSVVRISEFSTFAENINKVDTRTERILVQVVEPAVNHNGGQILFGIDGYLYICLGDGGKGGDPWGVHGNAQNMKTFLGKMLRIDVDSKDKGKEYAIPSSNPFVDRPASEVRHEIFAYGIRNIWRCGMDRGDRETGKGKGRIICGDVGQSIYEEIDIMEKGGNYGWRAKEGFECFDKEMCADKKKWLVNEVPPIHIYDHTVGKSVTGGHIYRGCLFPNMQGHYIYGDFMNGRLFKLVEREVDGKWENTEICMGDSKICTGEWVNKYPTNILSFGEDESGEIYMLTTDLAKTTNAGGKVFKFVDPSLRRSPIDCLDDDDANAHSIKGAKKDKREEIEGKVYSKDEPVFIMPHHTVKETENYILRNLSVVFIFITLYVLYHVRHKIFSATWDFSGIIRNKGKDNVSSY